MRRKGLSLAEVLVAVAIVAMLASVMIPTVLSRLDDSRAETIVDEMQSLQDAIQLFQRDVGRYPKRLDYLSELPGSGAVDACNVAISARNKANYRGPYINRMLTDSAGAAAATMYFLPTADTVDFNITRGTYVATGGGNQTILQITVSGLERTMIELIDTNVDGAIGPTLGIVRYTAMPALPAVANDNDLLWTIPIKASDC